MRGCIPSSVLAIRDLSAIYTKKDGPMSKIAKSEESSEGMGMMVLEGVVAFGAGVLVGRYLLPKQSVTQAAFVLPQASPYTSMTQQSAEFQRGYDETLAWLRENPGAGQDLRTYGLYTDRGLNYDRGRMAAWTASGRYVPETRESDLQMLSQIVNEPEVPKGAADTEAFQRGYNEALAWVQQYNSSRSLADYQYETGRGADYDAGRWAALQSWASQSAYRRMALTARR